MATTRIKRKARYTINNAVRSGIIHRPERCPCCGKYPGRARDGRSLIQAHHPNYRRPKIIIWECTKCHAKEHAA